MSRASPDTKLAEVIVEVEDLCGICREEPDPSNAVNLAVSNCYLLIHIQLLC